MENKINIAELLKDCPQGMELDCILYDNIYFDIVEHNSIKCYIQNKGYRTSVTFDIYGGLIDSIPTKCVIFPKGKTTWEGFVPPIQFKDGDIMATDSGMWVGIVKKLSGGDTYEVYVGINTYYTNSLKYGSLCLSFSRPATEEEKQKLFDAIKANGYKWNPETKTLENLPKFKVGDRIKYIYFDRKVAKVVKIHDKRYELDNGKFIEFQDENAYEISYDKFDINTLKPFDKVLVRDHNAQEWVASLFSNYNEPKKYKYICVNGSGYAQCIPYEGNEHLLGTTDDCDDYHKTWE